MEGSEECQRYDHRCEIKGVWSVKIEMDDEDVAWSFTRDWRLEGLSNGGIDGHDYALRRGQVAQVSNETCASCHLPFQVCDTVVVYIEGYQAAGFYVETYYHFTRCFPRRYE